MAVSAGSMKAAQSNGSSSNGIRSTKEQMPSSAPALLRFWLRLASSLPTIQVGSLDISVTLATIFFLSSLRFFFVYILVAVFHWPNELISRDAAASMVGIFHSLLLVPALGACFWSHPYVPHQAMTDSLPKWYQQSVSVLLQFCTGYMVYDGVLNILILKYPHHYTSSDFMFLGHHLATILYMTSCRWLQHGHQSAMMCMFLGELTNPFQNSFAVAELAQSLVCCQGPLSQMVFAMTECAFAAIYCWMRAVVGPLVCLHVTYDLLRHGRRSIPTGILIVWILLIWAVLIGSIPWIVDCWSKLQKYLPEAVTALYQAVGNATSKEEL
jgi:hypothetical protein